jgi:hypothetical protein
LQTDCGVGLDLGDFVLVPATGDFEGTGVGGSTPVRQTPTSLIC